MDSGSSHVVKKTKAWLATHPALPRVPHPKHASWLNQVELFFSTLTRRLLRRGQFTSRDELAERIDDFVQAYDGHDAKPSALGLRRHPAQSRVRLRRINAAPHQPSR